MKSLLLLSYALNGLAALVHLEWDVGWVTADPDRSGHPRRVIGVNGVWPPPQIDVNRGDRLQVKINNKLGDWNTTMHWHGIRQRGTNNYDGPEYVTQCPIPPGHSMVYDFPINQAGTYWYHSHVSGQYPDGLRGPLIVHDPGLQYKTGYDEEIVLRLSDWYYDEMRTLIPRFLNPANKDGVEPLPNSILINDTKEPKLKVQPNKTYLVRIVNIGAFLTYTLWFEDHDYDIIEVDGIYTEKARADQIVLGPAQRYSILLKTKSSTGRNYPFVAHYDSDPSPGFNPNATGWLVYNNTASLPKPKGRAINPFDDTTLVPVDKTPRFKKPDRTITLEVSFKNKADGINYAFFNDISYQAPQVPTLFTALNANSTAVLDPLTYGNMTNPFIIKKGEVVDIIIKNFDTGAHPLHLHGHDFQVLYRSPADTPYIPTGLQYPAVPMRRDTVIINQNGSLVLRFTADNPGIWLFHCHIEWHILQGLTSTFLEAPAELKRLITIPNDQYDNCRATGIDISSDTTSTRGNQTVNGFAAPDSPPRFVRRNRAISL